MATKTEKKICQNCKTDFFIEPEDFNFYEKIKVPPPTFCPECRQQRRMAWRNDVIFYNRNCSLCERPIISLYHKEKPYVVYCNKCWWSDKWDPLDYGKEIDFSRPFFEQFRELQNKVPLPALFNDDGVGSVNCEYTENVTFAKNCYMVSMSWFARDCMYGYSIGGPETSDVVDALGIFHYSQILYEGIFLEHCYNCRNCYYSSSLTDCSFCYDCKGCSDCFMCVNLRQKKYCIFNKEYSKEEYEQILKSYQLDTYSGTERAKKEFIEFLSGQVRRFADILNCTSCTGQGLINSKNSKDIFWCRAIEDSKYIWRSNEIKDSYDLTPAGKSSECYEGLTPDHDFQVLFSIYSLKSHELSYVENCHSSKYLFGCSGIRHGQYSILNKKYSKEEYFKLRDRLIEHMKSTGEYGEFFPSKMSHFGYNETIAMDYFPLTREEAINQGFKWWDKLQKTTGKETLSLDQIPDSILNVEESILNEVLNCSVCGRNYKIVKNEFLFYKKHSIPIPHKCFYCRNTERLKLENPFKLWHRKCMCDIRDHDHKGKCLSEFETSYAPDRLETIYCERCYNREVY
jgi:hypothetical protein